ncbi:cytochrome aa3 quinol oxidase subunit IV [Lentibacillus kapialis]|uniref:Quinol oxidase subunit 4 n=1 Tax=Lentibacillus kapialis TaxID=340214 RepID=A0A917PRP5_9BACI|nr:cytochrome aa3 quinol oxidase subunit IV [Lentibacillus kapialis]GGJ88519.1 cytochrome aa3 quinol oxidase subunit IV [Lentibacillus kapialis]
MANQSRKIPIQHIVGFALSITLTLLAAWTALRSSLPVMWIIIAILTMAVLQAAIQLFMFMHITERGAGHAPWNMMFHAAVIAVILVAGSLFTMSFGFHYDNGGGDSQPEQQQEQHQN